MKRFAITVAVILASAAVFYGLLSHVLRDSPASGRRTPAAPTFALGGLLSPGDLQGGASALARLSAAHCLESGAGVFPARSEELAGVVPWERGTVAYVLCPGAEEFRRESISGYLVGCEGRTASLYIRLGRMSPQDAAGCLVIAGGGAPALAEPDNIRFSDGRRVKTAFRVGDRLFAWTSPSDEVLPVAPR